MTMAGQIN